MTRSQDNYNASRQFCSNATYLVCKPSSRLTACYSITFTTLAFGPNSLSALSHIPLNCAYAPREAASTRCRCANTSYRSYNLVSLLLLLLLLLPIAREQAAYVAYTFAFTFTNSSCSRVAMPSMSFSTAERIPSCRNKWLCEINTRSKFYPLRPLRKSCLHLLRRLGYKNEN